MSALNPSQTVAAGSLIHLRRSACIAIRNNEDDSPDSSEFVRSFLFVCEAIVHLINNPRIPKSNGMDSYKWWRSLSLFRRIALYVGSDNEAYRAENSKRKMHADWLRS